MCKNFLTEFCRWKPYFRPANDDDCDALMCDGFSVKYDVSLPHSMVVQSTNEWIHAVPE